MKRNLSFTDSNGPHARDGHRNGEQKSGKPGEGKESWDVQSTMETMDRRYGTKFVEWIQSEENLECAATHLRKIAKEYDVKKVCACGRVCANTHCVRLRVCSRVRVCVHLCICLPVSL